MPEEVKKPRRYDSSRRQEHADQNRRSILEEARRLYLEQGYAATTIAQIAEGAGVAVQTVYKVFANKAGLLKALFDVSVVGDDEPVPMAERDVIGAIIAEPDAVKKITMYTQHLGQVMPRSAPIQLIARDAAAVDSGASEVWAQIRAETLNAMAMFARDLTATGQLRQGLSATEARDVLWVYHAPELFELMVLERKWSAARYARFISTGMIAALLN